MNQMNLDSAPEESFSSCFHSLFSRASDFRDFGWADGKVWLGCTRPNPLEGNSKKRSYWSVFST
jgi:hypothetical protein